MPKLWTESIEAHREAVRQATFDATAALVAEHGLRAVTMAQVAQQAGIGRATLYKYFPDLDAILVAWHEGQVASHLRHFTEIRNQIDEPQARLEAVLQTYASIQYEHHGNDSAALLHRGKHVARAEEHLRSLLAELLAEAARDGSVRGDVASDELAAFCLHALSAASALTSKAATERLVRVTLAGLSPPGPADGRQAAQRH